MASIQTLELMNTGIMHLCIAERTKRCLLPFQKMASRTLWAWFDLLSSYTRLDYFDVTLLCEDSKYNLAHKVVLATSSTLRTPPSPDISRIL